MCDNRRKLVAEAYVFEAIDFVEDHLSFFVAPLLRRDFSNWARVTQQRNNAMSAIDTLLRDALEIDFMEGNEFIEIYKQLGLEFKDVIDIAPLKILDELCVGSDAKNENETTFEAYSKALLNPPNSGSDRRAGLVYGQDDALENFLQLRPFVVMALLCLKRSPVFNDLYKDWQASYKCQNMCRHYQLNRVSENRFTSFSGSNVEAGEITSLKEAENNQSITLN